MGLNDTLFFKKYMYSKKTVEFIISNNRFLEINHDNVFNFIENKEYLLDDLSSEKIVTDKIEDFIDILFQIYIFHYNYNISARDIFKINLNEMNADNLNQYVNPDIKKEIKESQLIILKAYMNLFIYNNESEKNDELKKVNIFIKTLEGKFKEMKKNEQKFYKIYKINPRDIFRNEYETYVDTDTNTNTENNKKMEDEYKKLYYLQKSDESFVKFLENIEKQRKIKFPRKNAWK